METMEMGKSLNEYMQPENVKEGFVIDDLKKAEWALKKIAEHKAACKRIDEFADGEIAKIQDWAHEQTKSHEDDIKYFESLLMPFAASELQGKKTKTIKLPAGKMSFKKNTTYERDEKAVALGLLYMSWGIVLKKQCHKFEKQKKLFMSAVLLANRCGGQVAIMARMKEAVLINL